MTSEKNSRDAPGSIPKLAALLITLGSQLFVIVGYALPLLSPNTYLPGMGAEALSAIIWIEWLVLLGGMLLLFAVYYKPRQRTGKGWKASEKIGEFGDFGDFGDGEFAEQPTAPKAPAWARTLWRRLCFILIAVLLAALAAKIDGTRGVLSLLVLWLATFGGPIFGICLARSARERILWHAFARWWICLVLMLLLTATGERLGLLYFSALTLLDLANVYRNMRKQSAKSQG